MTAVHPIKCAANHDIASKCVDEILNMFFVGYELGTGIESQTEIMVVLLFSHHSTSVNTLFGLF